LRPSVVGPGSKIESKSERDQKRFLTDQTICQIGAARQKGATGALAVSTCLPAKLAKLSKQYSRILDGISVVEDLHIFFALPCATASLAQEFWAQPGAFPEGNFCVIEK
jgi:hypothetical protein